MAVVYGLLGKKLSHSFSKTYFEKKFADKQLIDHQYLNFELETISQFPQLIASVKDLKGLNVTNPYKVEVLPFLTALSPEAKEIGAVNCIKIDGQNIKGYNTDAYGFGQSIKPFLDTNHERALVLGTGGAAQAVAYALEKVGVEVYFVSTSKTGPKIFSYNSLNDYMFGSFKLIVNATPVGMWPDIHGCPPIPYQFLTPQHLCYDLIYNPAETLFLEASKKYGAVTMNGLSMLHLQAEKGWEIWNS